MSIKNVHPWGDRVIVLREEESGVTKGGLLLPKSAKEKSTQGEVIAIGKGKIDKEGKLQPLPSEIKKGIKVIFGKYAGTAVDVPGYESKECLFLSVDEILGIIE
jgi:chaperonin GroES